MDVFLPTLTVQELTLTEAAVLEGRSLYQAASALSRNYPDACDLVQDTIERALRHSTERLSRDAARRWLLVTLRRIFIDGCRAKTRKGVVSSLHEHAATEVEHSSEPPALWRLVDDRSLAASVRRIDPRLRRVYELHVSKGLPLTTIARRLGIPASTASTRLFRARQHLRASLEQSLG